LFYERLLDIYRSSECDKSYPPLMLECLESFVIEHIKQNKKFISPYKFALRSKIEVRDAIQFFMYFSVADGVFNIRFFFDCTRLNCGERIFLTNLDTESSIEQHINCPECDKEYLINDIIHATKAYFEVKPGILLPTISEKKQQDDPNSTIQALKGMPNHLKGQSPSSSTNTSSICNDEGDFPNVSTVVKLNQTGNGNSILSDDVLVYMTKYIRE
jgi:hypothetical protein